jgi:potassium efflux system protein
MKRTVRNHFTIMATTILIAAGGAVTAAAKPSNAAGQSSTTASSESRTAPTVAELDAELTAIEADRTLDDAQKAQLRQTYELALEAASRAAEFVAEAQRYRDAIETGPEQLVQLREALERAQSGDVNSAPDLERPTEELRRELETRRARLTVLREQIAEAATQITANEARPLQAGLRLPEAERELTAIQLKLGSTDFDDDGNQPMRRAERQLALAREAQLQSELDMLRYDQQSAPIRRELLAAQLAALQVDIERNQGVADDLAEEVNRRLVGTADRVRDVASRLPTELLGDHPTMSALVEEVRSLAEELEIAAAASRTAVQAETEIHTALQDLEAEVASLREQLGLGGGGRAMVQVLFSLDSRCARSGDELQALQVPPLEPTRLAALRIRERLGMETETGAVAPDDATLARALDDLVEARRDVLGELDQQYTTLVRALAKLEQAKQQYLDRAAATRAFIAEQLFGFGLRACPVIDRGTLVDLPGAVSWMIQPEHRRSLGEAVRSSLEERPLTTAVVLLISVFLIVRRPRMLRALEATGVRLRRTSADRYANTGEALGWSMLLALPLPLLVGYVSWTIRHAPVTNDWLQGLASGLLTASGILAATAFLVTAFRPGGLGGAHFGWRQETLDSLRRALVAGMSIYVPALVLTVSSSFGEASRYFDSLGRVSFMLSHAWLVLVAYRLLYTPGGVRIPDAQKSGFLVVRWRPVWSVVLVAAPIALIVIAAAGYLITAIMLSLGLLVTLGLIAGGALAHGLVFRWLRMRHRKLALSEALARRRSRHDVPTVDHATDTAKEPKEVGGDEEPRLDLEVVADQTRDLMRTIFGLGTFVAILAYWSQAYPLAKLAGSITIPLMGRLTVLQLAVSILAVVVTVILVRNLPGLLELLVLRNTSIFPGTRHAIITLCQYAVTAVGAAVALGVLEVDWAQFGWIAAALSVGLGFGLQEVVANFVCGLILLFERPLRVGDIVTVEGMTGTVTRIQMRATTILNWDYQEFVVPNKNLITSTLLNWTLTTQLNRVVIPVGVAYGSDTDRARQILLEVAADHPEILKEPAPVATFEQFADSSLSIVLRAHLPDMEHRLGVITHLHTEIDRRFKAEGIEIAFPQLDLHLRTGGASSVATEKP